MGMFDGVKSNWQTVKSDWTTTKSSFAGGQANGKSGFSNGVGGLLSGDFVGSALKLVTEIGGHMAGTAGRDKATAERIQERMDKLKASGGSISGINEFYRGMQDYWGWETHKPGNFEEMITNTLTQMTNGLLAEGYTYVEKPVTKKGDVKNGWFGKRKKYSIDYLQKVWSEPKQSVLSDLTGGGSGSGFSLPILAGIGFGLFKLLK